MGSFANALCCLFQVTIPLSPETLVNNHKVNLDDGRPKALQVETSEINILSAPIGNLSNDSSFNSTLKSIKTGWLFSNAHADSFPHEANVDGDIIPSFMEKLLSSGFQTLVLAPGDIPTCAEACLTTWHLEVRCVCVSFVHEMSESGVTHNTKPFVTDFPLNVWLFENLTNTKAKNFEPANKKFKPRFHAVVNIPSTISAAINHLELLFLMRLGDSLNNFQLMIEEIFTFKSHDKHHTNTVSDSEKPTESKSLITARRNQQITDVEFEFTGCVLIKSFHLNAYLPAKRKQKVRHPVYSESEETPTHQPKCKILLKAPTVDEMDSRNDLPHGEPHVSEMASQHNAVITGPITVSPDPGLQYALQRSLPGTPKILTPRSQSPSIESASTDTPTTLSHSGSLASMNIDEATCQFSGYQEDDFFIISTKDSGLKMFNEKDDIPAATQGSPASITEGLPHENLLEFTPPQNHTELGEEMLPGDLECDEGNDDKSTPQPVDANSTMHVPSDSVPSQVKPSHQTATQPHKQLPPANVQNQVEISEEMIPVVDDSNQQVQISINNSAEDPPEALPSNSSTTLENVIPEEKTLTISDLNEGYKFSLPVVEEIHWQLQVCAYNICAIPIVNPTGLIAKLSAGRIDLKEEPIVPVSGSTETLAHKDVNSGDADVNEYSLHPSVRGRFELGPRIYKYYPTLEELHIPCVVQLHVNGVNASLLLSLMENLALMFEDEIKSSIPVPLYIILEGNQFLILESSDGHAEDFKTLNVSVSKVCIQRGPEVPKLAVWKTEHLGDDMSIAAYKETMPVVGSNAASNTTIDLEKSQELDALLTSIKTFTASLQPQVEKLASLPQVQRISQAMLELQNVIGVSEHLEPPPQYSESVDHHNASTTIASLHKEVESLQQEQQLLQDQIKSDQEQLQARDTELSHLVSELVKSKDSEVAMKEVVFRLNNQIQDVVMENDQLKVTMARAGLRVPVGKRH